jgi:hypothetical protein
MQWPAAVAAILCVVGVGACRQAPPAESTAPAAQAPATPAEGAPAATTPPDAATAGMAEPPATTPSGTSASQQRPTPAAPAAPAPPRAPAPQPAQPAEPAAAAAAAAAQAAPEAAPVPAPPPEPEYRELTVPAGTALTVVLDSSVSSNGSSLEDTVRGHLASSVRIDGIRALPAGSKLVGTVTEAKASGKVKGLARVAFRFDRITAHGETHSARTSAYAREAKSTKGKDAKKIGIGAGAGAIVGGIIGGGKGAAIGAGVGGGAGTGAVLATKGEEVAVAAGSQVRVTLQETVRVRVRIDPPAKP